MDTIQALQLPFMAAPVFDKRGRIRRPALVDPLVPERPGDWSGFGSDSNGYWFAVGGILAL